MKRFYENAEKLTYPEADQLVDEYLAEMATQREHTTSVAVLRWSERPNTVHNRKRVHDALRRVCEVTGEKWAGRTVFRIPDDDQSTMTRHTDGEG